MRTALKALIIAILSITIFFSGALTAGLRHWFQPIAKVTIRNDSSPETIIKFTHASGGLTSFAMLPSLAKGQSTVIRFFVAGEGSYNIEATFVDGRVLKGGAGYIESGYTATEVVSTSSITSEKVVLGF